MFSYQFATLIHISEPSNLLLSKIIQQMHFIRVLVAKANNSLNAKVAIN